jgi:WD40 repeat protein
MASPRLIVASSPHTGGIVDFDLVVHQGRPLLVGSPDRSHLASTWDPANDEWTEYRLDNAEDAGHYTELTSLAAAVVDGRIVIGGGGEHHGFAMWDLESGKVRSSAWDGGVSSAIRAELGGRTLFVVGGSSSTNVELWNPSHAESRDNEGSAAHPLDEMVEVGDLFASSHASSAVAAGKLNGRPVLVANMHDGGVVVWDIEEQCPLVEFDDLDEESTDFAIATVDGRLLVVAATPSEIRLGDTVTGEWEDPLPFAGGEIECLAAGTLAGHPIAAAGFDDGAVCVWDLTRRRLLCEPFGVRDNLVYQVKNRVHQVRIADLDGIPVVITAQIDDVVRVWELPR